MGGEKTSQNLAHDTHSLNDPYQLVMEIPVPTVVVSQGLSVMPS